MFTIYKELEFQITKWRCSHIFFFYLFFFVSLALFLSMCSACNVWTSDDDIFETEKKIPSMTMAVWKENEIPGLRTKIFVLNAMMTLAWLAARAKKKKS